MRRPLVVALLAGLVLLLAAPAASAHALLRSSDPSSGASLGKAPETVTLTFTEPPDLTLSTALVLGAVARWPRRPELLVLLGVAAAATMLVHVAGGHASGEATLTPLNVLVQWAHLLAVGVWVGGFLWLLLGLRGAGAAGSGPEPGNGSQATMRPEPARASAGGQGQEERTSPAPVGTAVMTAPSGDERVLAVRRFSAMATVALSVVVLTGLTRAVIEVRSWHGLFSTSFGRTLLIKLALVAGLIALGAVNRFRIVPALRAGRAKVATLGSTVRAELALAILIVVAAAVLGELPPAQYVSQQAARQQAPAAVTVTGNDFATSVKVELTATPGTVGANQFSAKVVDYDSGQPIPATRVSLSFTLPSRPDVGASALDLKKTPDGRWQGQGILSIAGRWSITALVQGPSGSVTVPLQLQPRAAEGTSPQVKISKAPGQPTVYTIALQRGSSLQAYLDPGKPGPNVLHLTYFAANGSEQPMFQVHATATNPAGATADLSLSRFSAGHLVSNLSLNAGRWSFSVVGTSKAGDLTDARFEQVIQ